MAKSRCGNEESIPGASAGRRSDLQAVYFDTSFLYSVRFNTHLEPLCDYARHLEIPLLVPEVALLELIRERQVEFDKFKGELGKLNSMFAQDLYQVLLPDEPEGLVAAATRALLQDLGMGVIPLPEELSVRGLMESAVGQFAPFENNDRGFKDALILETIMNDMGERKFTHALLMTRDKVFLDNPIASRPERKGIRLLPVSGLEKAVDLLYRVVESRNERSWTELRANALSFLRRQFDEISGYLRVHLVATVGGVLQTALMGEPKDLPPGVAVRQVRSFEPKRVADAHPWKLDDEEREDPEQKAWLVSVETDFELFVSFYSGFTSPLLTGTPVALGQTGDIDLAGLAPTPQLKQEVRTVKRTVTVEATMRLADTGFSNLALLKAWVYLP